MTKDKEPTRRRYQGVMVSSTFTDLAQHRAALMEALRREELFAIGMEEYVPSPEDDVISSSLNMVRKGSAYICLISHRYGQVPESPSQNPLGYSVTRLEFEEAQHLDLPTLVFVMGDEHPVRKSDVETDMENINKLTAFKERAKSGRICIVFNSLEEFTSKAIHSAATLRRYLEEKSELLSQIQITGALLAPTEAKIDPIPTPPVFYAEPPYIGSHRFIGRQDQLDTLSDWATPADIHPVLLYEAIGGTGKSILTWEWTTKHSSNVRTDWAGRFWYSFYEKGAIMADFCRRALSYITGRPLDDYKKMKTLELGEMILHHLQSRSWLLILDGLERVLVAYHRFDAAQLRDEEASKPTDQIANRDPCAAIHPEDDDLLRAFSAAAPSKILITSRLVPRVMLNHANQPIPGVLRISLPGLRPIEAETLLRSCNVTGASQRIQDYLKRHCDCHPLVIGVLAGLINNYLPDKGNFDKWEADPNAGGQLNLANLDLVQKRNHILRTALDALPSESRQLLSTLALLSASVDYNTLSAFNPHLPPEPTKVEEPSKPEEIKRWKTMSEGEKQKAQQEYEAALKRRKEYNEAVKAWRQSPEFLAAPHELAKTVGDLERRGLLQYDAVTRRYDLHPVVRGIASGGLLPEEKLHYGQIVVDHFSQVAHSPYEQAETLEDLRNGLSIIQTLLQMGRRKQAHDAFYGDFSRSLLHNLEAYVEVLSLVRPFFEAGWTTLPDVLDEKAGASLAYITSNCLYCINAPNEALDVMGTALLTDIQQERWSSVCECLGAVAIILAEQKRFALDERFRHFQLDIATLTESKDNIISAQLCHFIQLSRIGKWEDAERMWQLLPPKDSDWPQGAFSRSRGYALYSYAYVAFWKGNLTESILSLAENLVRREKDRRCIRFLHSLRGEWHMEHGEWALAAESLHEAVRMARAIGLVDEEAETKLALAKFRLGKLTEPRHEANLLAEAREPFHRSLADLWLAIGDNVQAKKHALLAYKLAWADGEPYVDRYELNKSTALLKQLGEELPTLPPYNPAKDDKLPWESVVTAAINQLKSKTKLERGKTE